MHAIKAARLDETEKFLEVAKSLRRTTLIEMKWQCGPACRAANPGGRLRKQKVRKWRACARRGPEMLRRAHTGAIAFKEKKDGAVAEFCRRCMARVERQ